MLSKVFSRALKPTLTRAIFNNKPLCQATLRTMSTTTIAKIDKGKTKLTKALAREIKFEEENYQVDESVGKFLDQHGFSINDAQEQNLVELTKKVGNVTVQLCFQSRAPQFDDEDAEDNEVDQGKIQTSQQGEEEEDQFDDQNYVEFTVYLIQTNGKALTFECTSFDSEININFMSLETDVEGHKTSSRLERNNGYNADFSILDERLQTAFLEYLKSYGINEDVAMFVEHYSQDKDQRQYMQWLKDVNQFIEKPLE